MTHRCGSDCCTPPAFPPLPSEAVLRARAAARPRTFLTFLIDGADRYEAAQGTYGYGDPDEPWGDH